MSYLRSYDDFTIRKIKKLRDLTKSKGIHIPNSGFLDIFLKYYHEDPLNVLPQLEKEKVIQLEPVSDGYMMYIYGEGSLTIEIRLEQLKDDPEIRTCDIIKAHHDLLKDDPERLTTEFIQDQIGRRCKNIDFHD